MYRITDISERINSPTPPFFKGLKKLGWVLVAIGTSVWTSPVQLPLGITTAAGYMITVGTVLSVISQLTREDK